MEGSAIEHAPSAHTHAVRPRIFVVVAVGLILIGVAAWWIASSPARELRSAEALLAEAYTRQRAFEFRLPASAYAPVRAEQGEQRSTFSRPVSLLEAESLIARHLAKDPENVEWLRLRARADMLDQDYDDAVSTLKRATDAQPDDVSLLADLGAAYALRAEGERREIDYGAAIEMLWRFLRSRPDSPPALFNRAVVYERMFLYDDARKDWEHYLKLDPAGAWAGEARARKQAMERKVAARDQALRSLSSAPGYVEAVKDGGAYDPEFYLDSAVTEWLPASNNDASAREAVRTLARLLQEKHQDAWLEDLLQAKQDAGYRDATAHLAAAAKYNLADEAEAALDEARQARRIYGEAGVGAGVLRAKYEETLALYRSMDGRKCLDLANVLAPQAAALRYKWIAAEALMEEGTCRAATGDEGGGRGDFERALAAAREPGYATLELRALGLLGGNATSLGDQLAVWHQIRDRLATCWQAPHRPSRAFQFYFDLSKSSAAMAYKFSAFLFRQAAAEELSKTGNQALEGYHRAVLASLADSAGLPTEADREFRKASELFSRCRKTPALQLRRSGAELAQAESAVKVNPKKALMHLRDIFPPNGPFPTLETELVFYQVQGRAKLALGDLDGAEAAFRRSIECDEQRLTSLPDRVDRSGPLRKSGDAYRGAAYIELGRNPADALKLWEWYRSADLAGPRRKLDLATPLPRRPASDVVLSYVLLPDGSINVWILGQGRMECRRLSVQGEQLEAVTIRFLRQCADPRSSLSALRRDARLLYDWLIAPAARWLRPGRVLVIEPDGPIGALPVQALLDPAGNYLGGQFAIVVSRSLMAYQEGSHLPPLTSRSTALVIANPALGTELAKAFPPLQDAAREAQEVGKLFSGAKVLSGSESTLEALESARQNVEVFHFAGHSVASEGDAGLLLAPSGDGEVGGRLLKSSQLLRQDWSRCSLAVLSACSTGAGERNGFANPESLVRAFLNAGARRVIASRWNVDTVATAGFMRRFYQSVLSGALPATALQQAAEALRKDPATAHPYYWAAFQLFGYK